MACRILRLSRSGYYEWRGRRPSARDLDDAYLAHGRRLVESIGTNATLAVIPGAGHACHLEQPVAFLEVVSPFLEAH